jgi:hypothetical protein
LKAKQEVEREDKELKSKEEDQEKRSQEDESDRPHDLEFIHPTSQTKNKFPLEAIFTKSLTLLNNLENLHQCLKLLT